MLEQNKRKIKWFLQAVLYICFSYLIQFKAYISNKNTNKIDVHITDKSYISSFNKIELNGNVNIGNVIIMLHLQR